jgi:hypothetical protein
MRQLLESLTGLGDVYVGDVLLRRTRYDLALWSDDSIDGHIDITGIGEAVVLAGPDQLMLRLEDGRRLPFTLTGSGGSIVGRGALQS